MMHKTMNEELKENLIRKIEAGFTEKVKYPGDKRISTDDFELRGIVGKWQNLSYETIADNIEINFLTPEGLKYYLPAYILAVIHYPEAVDIGNRIIRHLTPPHGVAWKTQKLNMGADFTPEQKAAIRAFFEAYPQICPDGLGEDIGDQSSLFATWQRGVEYWQFYG